MTQLLLFNVTNGLIIGAFYVLMAIGLSLILNLSNVINFDLKEAKALLDELHA
jgi:branched-chain amino acid transport system permease protein